MKSKFSSCKCHLLVRMLGNKSSYILLVGVEQYNISRCWYTLFDSWSPILKKYTKEIIIGDNLSLRIFIRGREK